MKRSLPTIIGVVVLLLLCWWGLQALTRSAIGLGQPGSTYNTRENGTAALQRWLEDIGYKTKRLEYVEWQFEQEQKAIFIITPTNPSITQSEVRETMRWLNDGGLLIMVADEDNALLREFNITLSANNIISPTKILQPLPNLPVTTLNIEQARYFETVRNDGVVLAGSLKEPIVLTFKQGQGRVYLLSSLDLVSNQGLLNEQHARLVLNMTGSQPEGTTFYFDEIHHGRALPPKRPPGPAETYPPLVAAIVYSALVLGLWALWSGRRFGTVMPTKAEVAKRSSAEYVQSMAGLFQRGRQTGYMLAHYKTAFKRRIAKPYGFSPKLEDAEYVRELSRFTDVEEQRLLSLLNAMSMDNPSEEALLKLTNAADDFAKEFESTN